jgi:hypothetical protein
VSNCDVGSTCNMLLNQVLLPEYGGMQVKIDDKELFMFRFICPQLCAYSPFFFTALPPYAPPLHDTLSRDDEILGVLKSE